MMTQTQIKTEYTALKRRLFDKDCGRMNDKQYAPSTDGRRTLFLRSVRCFEDFTSIQKPALQPMQSQIGVPGIIDDVSFNGEEARKHTMLEEE